MFLAAATYVVSVSTSKVVGGMTSVFLANSITFTFEVLLSIVCIYTGGFSFTVAKSDINRFMAAAFCNYAYITLFYISASLLSVGNMHGSYIGLYIAFATSLETGAKVSMIFFQSLLLLD